MGFSVNFSPDYMLALAPTVLSRTPRLNKMRTLPVLTVALVKWGESDTLGSIVGHKWTSAERAHWVMENVPPYLLGVVVGLILSDCCLRIVKGRVNARLEFNQSLGHFAY